MHLQNIVHSSALPFVNAANISTQISSKSLIHHNSTHQFLDALPPQPSVWLITAPMLPLLLCPQAYPGWGLKQALLFLRTPPQLFNIALSAAIGTQICI